MSSIFKDRKIPKHLIIQDEYDPSQKSGLRFSRFFIGFLILVVTSYVATQYLDIVL